MLNPTRTVPQVFIVDDETGVAALCADSLRGSYRVKVFNSAQAALSDFDRGEQADVVLTDLKMPGMDGIEFVDRMRQRNVGGAVVMMSAFVDKESAMRAMEHQVLSVVEKPFELSAIRKAVTKAMEARTRDAARRNLELAHQRLARAAVQLSSLYRNRYTAAENQLYEANIQLQRGSAGVSEFIKEIRTESELEDEIERLTADIERYSRS